MINQGGKGIVVIRMGAAVRYFYLLRCFQPGLSFLSRTPNRVPGKNRYCIAGACTAHYYYLSVPNNLEMKNVFFLVLAICGASTVTISQNVGIGTNTPNTQLQINTGAAATSQLQFTNSASGTTLVDGMLVGINNLNLAFITNNEAQPLTLGTSGVERLRIDAAGRVGVGTSTPFSLAAFTASDFLGNGVAIYGESNNAGNASIYVNALNANANAGVGFQRSNSLKGYIGFNANNHFFMNVGGYSNVLFASSNTGGVGINTTVPAANTKLDVNGTTKTNTLIIGTGGNTDDFLTRSDATGTVGFRKGHKGLGLRYIICLYGVFPSASTGGNESVIGEVKLFAGTFAPNNWAFCEGQLISISSNTALFTLLGTQYGGNGQTTFALPDLRGAVPVGVNSAAGNVLWTAGERSN
jgi:microcystin-dependent protein